MSRLQHHPHRPRLRGAKGHVLNVLLEYSRDGICTLSHEDIAMLTGYCQRTVATSLSGLIDSEVIRLVRLPREKRNSYEVINAVSQSPA